MYHKKIFILIIVLLTCLVSAACNTEDIYIDDVEDDSPLTIYLISGPGFTNIVGDYNRMEAELGREIEIVKFSIKSIDDIEQMYDQMLNELSLGDGPDIILINQWTDKFIDINKMAQSEAFADMDILIENSETFDLDDYNKMVLDAGILNGKRVFLPMSYRVNYVVGVKECFEHNNMDIPYDLTLDVYMDFIEQYHQINNNDSALLGMHPIYLLADFIKIGQPIEKTQQLERLFEMLKVESKDFMDYKQRRVISLDDQLDYYSRFIGSNQLFLEPRNPGKNQLRRFYSSYILVETINESNIHFFSHPAIAGDGVKAYTDVGLAININSKHKNEAFKFVEYVLSHSTQSNLMSIYDLPVNNKTFDKEIEYFIEGYKGFGETWFGVETPDIPVEKRSEYVEYIKSAQTIEYIGTYRYIYSHIMEQSIEDYYNDKLTFNEMIDEINNKLSIYYTE